jgi:hypothetical protein
MQKPVVLLCALLLGGCATYVATSGRYAVSDPHNTSHHSDGPATVSVVVSISEHDRRLIQDYYRGRSQGHQGKTPPGLARRDQLPPGLAKRDTLPPGLRGRGLPDELEARLAALPLPYVRMAVGADIVLMNGQTRVIVDILRGVVTD